jgi:response regulator NasT
MVLHHRIMVVEPEYGNENSVYAKLNALGCQQLELLKSTEGLANKVAVINADVLVVSLESISSAVLNELVEIKQNSPLAVVIFASEYLPEMTKTVMASGVSSYIVDDVASERVAVILDLAMERFSHSQSLNKELERAQKQLSERKLVEKAKGIIMRQKNVTEDQAYTQIRSSAMNHGKSIAELSKRIISVFELIE